MTADMSTSLNVVSIAAVFWAVLRFAAIVWRRRDIRTRSSGLADVADDTGAAAAGFAGTAGFFGDQVVFSTPLEIADSTSVLPTLPAGPVAATLLRSTALALAIASATGVTPPLDTCADDSLAVPSVTADSAGEAGAAVVPEPEIVPRMAPTVTVSPSLNATVASTPSASACST